MKPEDDENQEKLFNFISLFLPETPNILLYPDGWMSDIDLRVIYNAARRTKGDVLEVGPWLGRSSTAIACGLRDREEEDNKKPVLYDIIDFGITSPEEWFERFNLKFKWDHAQGIVANAIFHPGGSNAVLVNNLKKLELLKYTNVIMRGDLIKSPIEKKYSMVFCDALHTLNEIDRTMPKLSTLLAPGCVMVADDVVTEEMAERICDYVPVDDYFFSRVQSRRRGRKVCVFTISESKGGTTVSSSGKTNVVKSSESKSGPAKASASKSSTGKSSAAKKTATKTNAGKTTAGKSGTARAKKT